MTRISNAIAVAGILFGVGLGTGAEARASDPPPDAAAYWAASPSAAGSATHVSPRAPQEQGRSTVTGGPVGGLSTGN